MADLGEAWVQRVTHGIPRHDSIDHDTSATNGDALEQCVCGPEWRWVPGEVGHLYCEHHALHGRF